MISASVLGVKDESAHFVRGTAAVVVTLAVSFIVLRRTFELCAVLVRQRWPEAEFTGLIVWSADFVALTFSIAIAIVVGLYAFKRPV